ncbi:unnamed protein product [Clavelina lepadiformis]|uniref:NXPE C-terminal domain-containing protein n=1 Tax=Clavelina lepadiformis TaxID=159417 RepID=A0ABP0G0F2_CLALP
MDSTYVGAKSLYYRNYQSNIAKTTTKKLEASNITKDFALPDETKNPNSAFYGNIYKDTYGLPLSAFGVSSFKQIRTEWIHYLPWLATSLLNYRSNGQSNDTSSFTTITSKLFVKNRTSYVVGDVFVAHIQARDQLMRNKMFGGDYFRARLIRTRFGEAVDGIPCAIYDHANGTYTVKAPLLMSGDFTLEVKLLLSVEGIDRWIKFTELGEYKVVIHTAVLKSMELVYCGIHLTTFKRYSPEKLCDYSNPRNQEPWFCVRPPSGICHPIVQYRHRLLPWRPPFQISVDSLKEYGKFGEVFGSSVRIKIIKKDPIIWNVTYGMEYKGTSIPAGYLRNDRWVSLQQKSPVISLAWSRNCFKNKVIYMVGDSTMRQFFEIAVAVFNLTQTGPSNKINRHASQLGQDKTVNITIYYRTHGVPVSVRGVPGTRPYISDTIETLKTGGPALYVIFNIGVHLLHYDTSYFVHRILKIRDAIADHLRIFPDTRFILRGLNVVETMEEWAIFRLEFILREVFKSLIGVLFLNFWDYTTVSPLKHYHPGEHALNEEALLLFSYVCNWPK